MTLTEYFQIESYHRVTAKLQKKQSQSTSELQRPKSIGQNEPIENYHQLLLHAEILRLFQLSPHALFASALTKGWPPCKALTIPCIGAFFLSEPLHSNL